jgi:hypothetical protein
MRRRAIVLLALLLAAGIHVDYHLARPLRHRLSLEWQHHWIFAALLFAGVAYLVALRSPPGAFALVLWRLRPRGRAPAAQLPP